MQSIYFVDSNFTYELSTQAILSIRYATDGFSFCVHDARDKLMVFVHEPYAADSHEAVLARLKNYLVNDVILNLRFKKAYLMACFSEKILIPGSLFNKAKVTSLYSVSQEIAPEDILLYHHIESMDAYLIEAINSPFNDFIREHFPGIRIVNEAYPFIQGALSKVLHDSEQIFLNIQDSFFDVLFIKDARVQLFNTFNYRMATDIVYFLLNCIKECQIRKEKLHVSVFGPATNDGKLKELLSTYLPHPYFATEPLLKGILNDKEINPSHFIHLLNLHRCGL